MRKVLVTSNSFGKYDQEPIKKLEAAGFEVVRNPYGRMMEEDEFIEQMQGAETVILSTEKVTKKVIDACPDLKMISRYGVGLDNIDLDYCKEKGIPVTVTRGGNSNAGGRICSHLDSCSFQRNSCIRNESQRRKMEKIQWP